MKNKWILCLAAIFFMHLLTNIWVLHKDNIYPLYNSGGFVETGYRMARDVSNHRIPHSTYPGRNPPQENPPLIEYLLMLNVLLFGGDIDIMMHTNLLFLLILIWSLYKIGERISGQSIGLLSVIICLSFPVVFGMSRIMYREFPLMCAIILSYYLLFKTEYFRNIKYSLLWSFSLGCGLLIRWTLPIYLVIPVLIYTIKAFMVRDDKLRLIRTLISCFFIILFLINWWYAPNIKGIIINNISVVAKGDMEFSSKLIHLIKCLCNKSMYFPMFLLFVIATPLSLLKFRFEKLIIISGIISPLLVYFIFATNMGGFTSNRYFLPMLPMASLIIANAISLVNKKALYIFAYFVVVLVCFVQFGLVNVGLGRILKLPCIIKSDIENSTLSIITEEGKVKPYISEVDPKEIFNLMDRKKTKEPISLLLAGNFQEVEAFCRIEPARGKRQIWWYSPVPIIMGNPNLKEWDSPQILDKVEFVLTSNKDEDKKEQTNGIYGSGYIPKILTSFEKRQNEYEEIGSFNGQDGIKMILFKRKETELL